MNENTVLKDNNGNIVDPHIPRYEKEIIKTENSTAIKYADGRLECLGQVELKDFPGSNQLGQYLVRSNTIAFPNFPVAFSEVPQVNFQVLETDSSGFVGYIPGNEYKPTKTNPGKPVYLKIANGTFNAKIGYRAFGFWK